MRATKLSAYSSASSKAWLARHLRDPYVKSRTIAPSATSTTSLTSSVILTPHFRSRAAFKLLEIDEQWGGFLTNSTANIVPPTPSPPLSSNMFGLKPTTGNVQITRRPGPVVVDLGAAPGGWSQVVAWKMGFERDTLIVTPRPETLVAQAGQREGQVSVPAQACSRRPTRLSQDGEKRKQRGEQRVGDGRNRNWEDFDPLNIDDEILALSSEPSKGVVDMTGRGTLISVDLLPMTPIPGSHFIQGDFLSAKVQQHVRDILRSQTNGAHGENGGMVDVVLSDMAANISGNQDYDVERSLEICEAVLLFARKSLKTAPRHSRDGVVLLKHFAHPLLQKFREERLEPNFWDVRYVKPSASRGASSEGYFLCRGWRGKA